MTAERLEELRKKARSVSAEWLTREEVEELFSEIDSLRHHNQVLADGLNDWRDEALALRGKT